MTKTTTYIILIILITGIFNICKGQTKQAESSWSSMDPLSVPLKVRKGYYSRGNIVPNSSFEHVKYSKDDNGSIKVDLKGWQIIGKDVKVTDIRKPNYDSANAYKGNHAIKIVRKPKSIKDINNPIEGVVSDYIKVIPGNYNFTFYARLKNILPTYFSNSRYKRRIGKGIDIHFLFFDKDKKQINPGVYYSNERKKIDNSFKGFSFSNYYYIKNFKWGEIQGKAWTYPFSTGDLPDSVRYVRIFFGLKVAGSMWIDNVNYHLSKWNFTPLERMKKLSKRKYRLTDLMIPTPKRINHQEHIAIEGKKIAVAYERRNSQELHATIKLLKEKISKFQSGKVSVKVDRYALENYSLKRSSTDLGIVLIKNVFPFTKNFSDAFKSIKGKEQGYFIRRKGRKIFIGANTTKGFFYGVCSLSQLMDYENSRIDYADITDWPDFKGRSTKFMHYNQNWSLKNHKKALKKQLKEIDFYAFYKINTFYSGKGTFNKIWWNIGKFYPYFYKKVGEKTAQYGNILNLGVQLNTTFQFGSVYFKPLSTLSDSLRNLFSYGTKAGFEKLKHTLKPALDAGANTVMFCSDDNVPLVGTGVGTRHTLFSDADRARFTNLAAAQAYMLNELKSWMDKSYGDTRLEFVPPAYSTEFVDKGLGSKRIFFKDLNKLLDPSIAVVWTGPTVRSLSYDMADIHRVLKIFKRKPMIWDNSQYARNVPRSFGGYPGNYPRKSVMNNIFQPFDIQYPKNFPSYLDSHYYNNLGGYSEIRKIQYMTFADFAWNTGDYKPDFSLFKALVHYVGKENAKVLLQFNDDYNRFIATLAQVRLAKKLSSNHTCSKSEQQRRQADQQIKSMEKAFDNLKSIDNIDLRQELKKKMDSKIDAWYALCK